MKYTVSHRAPERENSWYSAFLKIEVDKQKSPSILEGLFLFVVKLDFQPAIRVQRFTEDDIHGFGVVQHLFGEAATVGFNAVQHSVDQVDDILTFTLTDGGLLLIARIGNDGLHAAFHQHDHIGLVEDGAQVIWRSVGDIGESAGALAPGAMSGIIFWNSIRLMAWGC
jgi:hypothetical protein